MPKLGMEEIRRRQLIEATIASIHEVGFAESSLSRISAKAAKTGRRRPALALSFWR